MRDWPALGFYGHVLRTFWSHLVEELNINTCTSDNKSGQLLSQGKRGGRCLIISRLGFVHFYLCPSTIASSCIETGASCSVVFFTAYKNVTNIIHVYYWYVDCWVFLTAVMICAIHLSMGGETVFLLFFGLSVWVFFISTSLVCT